MPSEPPARSSTYLPAARDGAASYGSTAVGPGAHGTLSTVPTPSAAGLFATPPAAPVSGPAGPGERTPLLRQSSSSSTTQPPDNRLCCPRNPFAYCFPRNPPSGNQGQEPSEWELLLWDTYAYIFSQTLAAATYGYTAQYYPMSGQVNSGPGGGRQTWNNVFSQEIYSAAAVLASAAAQVMATRAYRWQGRPPPAGRPPTWGTFARNSVAYMLAGPLSQLPTELFYRWFPPSGTLLTPSSWWRAVSNNFNNGFLGSLFFVATFFLVRRVLERCGIGPDRAEETNPRRALAWSIPLFVFGNGLAAVTQPWFSENLPTSGQPGAGEGPRQLGQDLWSQFLSLVTSTVGALPVEQLVQWIRHRAEAAAATPPAPPSPSAGSPRDIETGLGS